MREKAPVSDKVYVALLNVSDSLEATITALEKDRKALVRYVAAIVKNRKKAEPRKKRVVKANGEAAKKVGVMAEIKRMLQRSKGATIKEITTRLVKKFPERPEKGMTISTRAFIYVIGPKELHGKKLKKERNERRGNVFRYPARA